MCGIVHDCVKKEIGFGAITKGYVCIRAVSLKFDPNPNAAQRMDSPRLKASEITFAWTLVALDANCNDLIIDLAISLLLRARTKLFATHEKKMFLENCVHYLSRVHCINLISYTD